MEYKNFKNGYVVIIELHGHYPTHEQHARIEEAVLQFVDALLESHYLIEDIIFTLTKQENDIAFENDGDIDVPAILNERAEELEKWLKRSLDEVFFETLEFVYELSNLEDSSPLVSFIITQNI